MLQVNPVAHLACEFRPLTGVHHHILTAGSVVVINGNLLSYILLGNAERFLHRQLHRQSVGVPASLALNLKAFHGLVAQYGVLYGASHHMVYARMAVGRRGTFEEYKLRSALALVDAFAENVVFLPLCKYLPVSLYEIKPLMF